jgi:hypothetical protein
MDDDDDDDKRNKKQAKQTVRICISNPVFQIHVSGRNKHAPSAIEKQRNATHTTVYINFGSRAKNEMRGEFDREKEKRNKCGYCGTGKRGERRQEIIRRSLWTELQGYQSREGTDDGGNVTSRVTGLESGLVNVLESEPVEEM